MWGDILILGGLQGLLGLHTIISFFPVVANACHVPNYLLLLRLTSYC
jgi:hypothetical protein